MSVKGEKTKQLLIDTASELFYEKGILSTTVSDITNKADANKGLFSYYFKTKENLAAIIHTKLRLDLRNVIAQKIFSTLGQCDFKTALAVESRKTLQCAMEDRNLLRFIIEASLNPLGPPIDEEVAHKRMHFYDLQKRLANPNISDADLHMYSIVGQQIIRSIYVEFYKGNLDYDEEYIEDYIIWSTNVLFQLDKARIDELIENSKRICKMIDIKIDCRFRVS